MGLTHVPMLIVIKHHDIQCNGVAYMCVFNSFRVKQQWRHKVISGIRLWLRRDIAY